jgi:chemotaxis protein methyltransferase CheR
MEATNIEDIELDLLLEAIFRRYGYDFRDYSRASLKRRVKDFLTNSGHEKISDIIAQLLYDHDFFQKMLEDFSVTVTEMFRDPDVYCCLRKNVLPFLRTYPFIKVWHAGCSSGEEVYSLAILLLEEGLYDRTIIYATDLNGGVLQKAKEGIYPISEVKQYIDNYRKAGGGRSLTDYFDAHYDSVIMSRALKKNITFARHNLVSDQVFGEIHLILCRNVMIYFNRTLQGRVFRLFHDSLVRGGFLCLGKKESLQFSEICPYYDEIDPPSRIYRKKTNC